MKDEVCREKGVEKDQEKRALQRFKERITMQEVNTGRGKGKIRKGDEKAWKKGKRRMNCAGRKWKKRISIKRAWERCKRWETTWERKI